MYRINTPLQFVAVPQAYHVDLKEPICTRTIARGSTKRGTVFARVQSTNNTPSVSTKRRRVGRTPSARVNPKSPLSVCDVPASELLRFEKIYNVAFKKQSRLGIERKDSISEDEGGEELSKLMATSFIDEFRGSPILQTLKDRQRSREASTKLC
jgi:hypothetical protein